MNANVRCVNAAGARWFNGETWRPVEGCGWKGQRKPRRLYRRLGTDARREECQRKVTAKPCPRCGGRVQLIQPQPSP